MTIDDDRAKARKLRFRSDALEKRDSYEEPTDDETGSREALERALEALESEAPGLSTYIDAVEKRSITYAARAALIMAKSPKPPQALLYNQALGIGDEIEELTRAVQVPQGSSVTRFVEAYVEISRRLADLLDGGV